LLLPSNSGERLRYKIPIYGRREYIKNEIRILLNFYNKSDELIKIGESYNNYPKLSDELGNSFDYKKSKNIFYYKQAIPIHPKSNTNVTLYFKKDLTREQVGKRFSLILLFIFYPSNDDFKGHSAGINFTQLIPHIIK
jgi:hypothetical protein